jgi:hypothetical protein
MTKRATRLGDINGRSKAGRRLRALVRAFERDLGGDLSTADLAMARNAAFLTLQCEQLQLKILNGEVTANINNDLVRSTNACRHLLAALRIEKRKRKPRPGTTLAEYIATKKAAGIR